MGQDAIWAVVEEVRKMRRNRRRRSIGVWRRVVVKADVVVVERVRRWSLSKNG